MRAFTTTMAKFFASMSANDHHKHVGKPAAIVARVVFTLIALALPLCSALSKRIAPPTVTPVIHEGVRYVAPTDDGRRAYVEAWDVKTNKRLEVNGPYERRRPEAGRRRAVGLPKSTECW